MGKCKYFGLAGLSSALLATTAFAYEAAAEFETVLVHPADASCSALVGKLPDKAIIDSAEPQAAGASAIFPPVGWEVTMPAHCLVRGRIEPRTGIDGKPYAIGFELRLPEHWNGRFLFQGGGGHDGRIIPAVGGLIVNGPRALDRGFAVVTTDGGHTDSGVPGEAGDYGFDPQARLNYGNRAIKRVVDTVKPVIARYYGQDIAWSYFSGCSNGGRQAMMASQRYFDDFDGIVAGAPGARGADASLSTIGRAQKLEAVAPRKADGTPDYQAGLLQADVDLIVAAYTQQCDALDGLSDGFVEYFRACRFDVTTLACTDSKTTQCLAPPTLAVWDAITSPTLSSTGEVLYPGFRMDTSMTDPAWRGSLLGHPLISPQLASRPQQVAFLTPPMPDTDVFSINIDDLPALTAEMGQMMSPTSTDLSGFRARNGKILFYHGAGDQMLPVDTVIEYFEELQQRYGTGGTETPSFARLFVVPGFLHCFGGPGMTDFDDLGTISNWVEKGQAPDRITAINEAVHPGMSRPLCPYPAYARYTNGDPQLAASYQCQR